MWLYISRLIAANEAERSVVLATNAGGRSIQRSLNDARSNAGSRASVQTAEGPGCDKAVSTIDNISDITQLGMQFSTLVATSRQCDSVRRYKDAKTVLHRSIAQNRRQHSNLCLLPFPTSTQQSLPAIRCWPHASSAAGSVSTILTPSSVFCSIAVRPSESSASQYTSQRPSPELW